MANQEHPPIKWVELVSPQGLIGLGVKVTVGDVIPWQFSNLDESAASDTVEKIVAISDRMVVEIYTKGRGLCTRIVGVPFIIGA